MSLLRRFPNEPDQFLEIPLYSIFIPSKRDKNGLSLNREGFITAVESLALALSENMRVNGGALRF